MDPYEIRIIANPMAGRDEPFFGPVNAVMSQAGIRWNIDVTNDVNEEWELAQRAVAEGAKVVVAFGGDGTVSAVAEAIAGHPDVVLGILPGGTANVFARELGIPMQLEDAAALLAGPHEVRTVDLGTAVLADGSERTFILRVSVGLEATAVEESDRENKERFGELAYIMTGLRQLAEPPVAHYELTSPDGDCVELDGLFGVLMNSGHMGMGDARYAPGIEIDDGLLDGLIAPAAVPQLAGAAAAALTGGQADTVARLTGPELTIACDPPQRVTVDGEVCGDTPVTARVRPGAVRVIAPLREDASSDETTQPKGS